MFGNRFAYEFQGSGAEGWVPPWRRHGRQRPRLFGHRHGPFGHQRGAWGNDWTPPWLPEEGRGTHFFAMRGGRGPFGRGGPFGFGSGGPFGPGGEGGRFFGRGDMKFALLELLQERPMHGYEMMKALAEKSGGFYTPSPGSIYPTLQMLEEGGFVTGNEVEGKKVYTITGAGRAMLAERKRDEEGFAGPPWMRRHGRGEHREHGEYGERGGHSMRLEMQALRSEAMEVARLFAIAGRSSLQNPEQLTRLRGIIERTRSDLTTLIYGEHSTQQGQASTTTPQSPETPTVDQA
jgi:DNA-binding PadR family transcriptional regulator